MQFVAVRFGAPGSTGQSYDYCWEHGDGGRALTVGDRVLVPPNWVQPDGGFASVVKVYENREQVNYKGELARIMGVLDAE